jgi:sucrose phosphorylase
MEDSSRDSNRFQFERFILTQLLVMALKGVPAFYLPALLASENDIKSFSMTGQRRDLNREKFKLDNLLSTLNNPESNANKNLKYLCNAMDVRSQLKQFHPNSEMSCLSKGRSDIVVIKRGKGPEAIFAIHNMTENKINYQLNDNELPAIIDNDFNMQDFLTSAKYNWKNISLDPFQVIWLGAL